MFSIKVNNSWYRIKVIKIVWKPKHNNIMSDSIFNNNDADLPAAATDSKNKIEADWKKPDEVLNF